MSQKATESVLGRLICDDEFRREFYRDSTVAVTEFGLFLTDIELASLRSICLDTIERFARSLDERIRRARDRTRG